MKKSLFFCVLLTHLLLPRQAAAQPARPQDGSASEVASIMFTFNSACDDCATQSGEVGENRYFIDVPISNNPSPAKSGAAEDLNMEVKVKHDRLIYSFMFKPGTAPRAVWRNGGRLLQVFFVPPEAARSETTPRVTVPSARSSRR